MDTQAKGLTAYENSGVTEGAFGARILWDNWETQNIKVFTKYFMNFSISGPVHAQLMHYIPEGKL